MYATITTCFLTLSSRPLDLLIIMTPRTSTGESAVTGSALAPTEYLRSRGRARRESRAKALLLETLCPRSFHGSGVVSHVTTASLPVPFPKQ
jgi:hypothetical protein